MDNLIKPTALANYLGISISMIYKLIKNGQLRSIKIGRCVRVRQKDLETFLEENTNNQSEIKNVNYRK
jgi:excisionase family DNA binding protein